MAATTSDHPDPAAVTIARLGPADLNHMRALNDVFGVAFEDAETYGGEPPPDDYLTALLAKDSNILVVAARDSHVIGGLVAYEFDKFERRRREIYIYDLAVAEAHRRMGVATALIRRVQTIAAGRGAWVVYVQADYTDPPAVALYEKLGVREDVMHFDLEVSPAP